MSPLCGGGVNAIRKIREFELRVLQLGEQITRAKEKQRNKVSLATDLAVASTFCSATRRLLGEYF
jgi:hypothetical protein